jgi:ATP-binding cassette, subfamily B, bacterial MsbA
MKISVAMRCTQTVQAKDIVAQFIRENPGLFAAYLLFLFLIPLTEIGVPHVIGRMVQSVQKMSSRETMFLNLSIIVGLIALAQIGHAISDTIDVYVLPRIVKIVRERIVSHIFHQQSTQLSELKSGEINTKIIKLPVIYYGFIEQWKNTLIPELAILIAGIGYLLVVQPLLGVAVAVAVVVVLGYSYKTVFQCEPISQKRDRAFNATVEETDDILRNSVSVLNANQQDQELQRIDRFHIDYDRASKDTFRCSLRPRYIFLPILVGLFFVYIAVSYRRIQRRQLSIAIFVAVLLIVIQVLSSIFKLLGNVKDAVLKWGSLQNSMKIFELCQKETLERFQNQPPKEGIFIDRVSFQYESDDGVRPVLKDYSLYIPAGQCVVLEGKIGSGKSTLLKLLNKYDRPTGGQIYIQGISFDLLSPVELHRIMGYVPQSPILFNRSIYENIVYGVEPVPSKATVEERLRSLGVGELIDELPKGLDTMAGKNGSNLSGGQRQIVWFLRVLFHETPYLILDEPTSAMDQHTKKYVYNLLEKIKKDKTILIVSHDPWVRRYADRSVVMEGGGT